MKYFIAAHPIQRQILQMVAEGKVKGMVLRDIAKVVGIKTNHPQQVKHHLNQMVKYGYLDIIGGEYKVGKLIQKR